MTSGEAASAKATSEEPLALADDSSAEPPPNLEGALNSKSQANPKMEGAPRKPHLSR
jgi:hypothetical protein